MSKSDGLPLGEWWMFYDNQIGRWCVYDDGPPKVTRSDSEVFHVWEVCAEETDLRAANQALMTERTSLIATKREQLDALTAERDMWRALALRGQQ